MAKNSPGASQRTRECAPCSAPTSLSVAPRVKPTVRNSVALKVKCVTFLKEVTTYFAQCKADVGQVFYVYSDIYDFEYPASTYLY